MRLTDESYRCVVPGQGHIHDWRLFEIRPRFKHEVFHIEGQPGFGYTTLIPDGDTEVWYCSRCRLVDEREVPGGL